MIKIIKNANIITKTEILKNKILIFNDKIIDILDEEKIIKYNDALIIDAKNNYVSAGFIDIHIHGIKGNDVMDDSIESLEKIRKDIVSTGVTSFLATTLTASKEKLDNVLKNIENLKGKVTGGAEILGCHLEGPFINSKYKGAQNEKYIQTPDIEFIKKYKDVIKKITLAPELEGSLDFIKECKEIGIITSLGHTEATYEQAIEAINHGASQITHTFNAMTSLHHRKPGLIGAALENDEVTCEIIIDNIHLHPAIQRIILKTKPIDKIILITDAMRACMMKDGMYDLGGLEVDVKNNKATLKDGTIAGSVLTMNTALKNFYENTKLSLPKLISLVTVNPAKDLKLNNKGEIRSNYDADLVIFDKNFKIIKTLVRGEEVIWR